MTNSSGPSTDYQAVLFDLDGTLLDTAPDFITATNLLLARKGREALAGNLIRDAVTNGSMGIITTAFDLDKDDPQVEPLRQEFLTLYMDNIVDRTRPFPGITELLTALGNRGVAWGIVTNKPLLYTNAILDQLPLSPAPSTVICPDHVANTKPHPESIFLACSQLGVAPEQTIYVGDHLRDIEAGLNAGTTTIAAAYGYISDEEDITSWGAHHIVQSASNILELLL